MFGAVHQRQMNQRSGAAAAYISQVHIAHKAAPNGIGLGIQGVTHAVKPPVANGLKLPCKHIFNALAFLAAATDKSPGAGTATIDNYNIPTGCRGSEFIRVAAGLERNAVIAREKSAVTDQNILAGVDIQAIRIPMGGIGMHTRNGDIAAECWMNLPPLGIGNVDSGNQNLMALIKFHHGCAQGVSYSKNALGNGYAPVAHSFQPAPTSPRLAVPPPGQATIKPALAGQGNIGLVERINTGGKIHQVNPLIPRHTQGKFR